MIQGLEEPRRLLGLASLLVSAASWIWVGPWLGVGFFAVGAATVAMEVHERRQKGADDPTVLRLGPPSGSDRP